VLKPGDSAPPFALADQSGRTVSLGDYAGRKLVLYFYPKDQTPGCTQEACSFRDQLSALAERGVAVVGVSPDSQGSHLKFAEKHGLGFPLLVDADHVLAEAFGAWGEKTLYGRTFMGIKRTTFLIDERGVIEKVWAKPKTKIHAEEVLAAL
jgi:peroxiredoxin Q/BCP